MIVKSTQDSPAMRGSVDDFQNHPMFRRIACVVAELLTKGNVAAEASNSSRLLKLRHAR
jgi:hypothetical protein